jgi:hypothetical protein
MKTAIFRNITNKPFTGYWDGKKKTFAPGAEKLLDASLAEHYAKHLTNQILIEQGDYTSTSPNKPDEVPKFKNIFDKICEIQEDEDEDEMIMPAQESPRQKIPTVVDNKAPQYIGLEEDEDEEFEGMDDSKNNN